MYFVAFEFNSDVDCRLSLLSSLPDSAELAALRHNPGSGVTSSRHYLFPRGSERNFTGEEFPLWPGRMSEEELGYDPESGQDTFPIAILMETADGMQVSTMCWPEFDTFMFPYLILWCSGSQYQNQLTLCTLDRSSDRGYTVKVLKQKVLVSGFLEFLVQTQIPLLELTCTCDDHPISLKMAF